MKLPKTIKVVGLGGIGGYLVDFLARYLSFLPEYQEDMSSTICDLYLIDGDKFEDRNQKRQDFEYMGNKAEEKARIFGKKYPKIFFRSISSYLNDDNVILNIREGNVVFSCVDNHSTRRLISERCEELDDIVLISGGNDIFDGNVQIHVKENGKDITPSIMKYHPEIRKAYDGNPADDDEDREGCEQAIVEDPQLLFTNVFVANIMCSTFRNWQENRLDYGEVYFDINEMVMRKYTLSMRPV